MPTGYTAKLADGHQDITEFLTELARGMGFMILMRDEPYGAPIPERFEPSEYNAKALREARARMADLNSLTPEQAEERAHADFLTDHEGWMSRRAKRAEQAARYRDMIDKVTAWEPTHHAMKGMKTFALEQLRGSLDFDCMGFSFPEPVEVSGEEWLEAQIKEAHRNIEYHAAEYAKEVERTESRNDALRAFRAEIAALNAVAI
jgi:hypothetical protein